MFDVVIIGGGPAGSTAALYAVNAKLRTLLIDFEDFPRNKACGGGLSPRTIKEFPYIEPLMEFAATHQMMANSTIDNSCEIQQNLPICYFVKRSQFDYELLKEAQKAGTEIWLKKKIKKIEEFPDHISILLTDGTIIESKFVIGADGIGSMVRNLANLQRYHQKKQRVFSIVMEQHVSEDIIVKFYENKPTMYVIFNFAGSIGYGWVFGKKDSINIGFGENTDTVPISTVRQHFDDFLTYCLNQQIVPAQISKSYDKKEWIVPMNGPMKKYTTDRILLIGDAAGFVHPISGEGIYYAMWSGRIAAEVIAKNNQNGENLVAKNYRTRCHRQFGRDLQLIAALQVKLAKQFDFVFDLIHYEERLKWVISDFIGGEQSLIRIGCRGLGWMIVAIIKKIGKKENFLTK
jgi:geranylgeranyl reductase family protein